MNVIPPVFHVVPINDLREHAETLDGICWCLPRMERPPIGVGLIYIHNSADGRELDEDPDLENNDDEDDGA